MADSARKSGASPLAPERSDPLIAAQTLRELQQRSDARGLFRLFGHLLIMVCCAAGYALARERTAGVLLTLPLAIAYGFTFVTMFAAMHESVHRTAFKSQWLNDSVGWLAGLLSFYNSSFYRHYHAFHHRYTQLPGKDPERNDRIPSGIGSYLVEMSGASWWLGKLRTHFGIALGRTAHYPYLNDNNRSSVVRSVRLQLAVYAGLIAASVVHGGSLFAWYWLLPLALAQPLLRVILLAEHTGCAEGEGDGALRNTRTTHTVWPVRFLMWEMPFHAEHHRHPALPFFSLASAHALLAPHLAHVGRRGYVGVHRDFLRGLSQTASSRAVSHEQSQEP